MYHDHKTEHDRAERKGEEKLPCETGEKDFNVINYNTYISAFKKYQKKLNSRLSVY